MTLDFYLRLLQATIAPGAVVTVTNDIHGLATQPLARLGIPSWFIRWIGLWKGLIITLNFLHEGEYVPLAQSMISMLMGGAIYSHAAIERKPLRTLPAIIFLGTSVCVPILRGAPRPVLSAVVSLGLAATGYAMGYGVQIALSGPPAPSKR
jgi:hypothetical protein